MDVSNTWENAIANIQWIESQREPEQATQGVDNESSLMECNVMQTSFVVNCSFARLRHVKLNVMTPMNNIIPLNNKLGH